MNPASYLAAQAILYFCGAFLVGAGWTLGRALAEYMLGRRG